MFKHRSIHFKVWDNDGTTQMRGRQIMAKLIARGHTNVKIIENDSYKLVKNSIIIFLKHLPPTQQELYDCKNYNNILIWDVVDCFSQIDTININKTKMVDNLIYTNSKFKRIITDIGGNPNGIVIPHHWDERLENTSSLNRFNIGYVGMATSLKHYDNIKNSNVIMITDRNEHINNITNINKINCFIDIKHTDSLHWFMKPAEKVSNASAIGANIILNRHFGALEILDIDYPYYCSNDWPSVYKMMKYARETYNSNIWNVGLEMMQEVKEKTILI